MWSLCPAQDVMSSLPQTRFLSAAPRVTSWQNHRLCKIVWTEAEGAGVHLKCLVYTVFEVQNQTLSVELDCLLSYLSTVFNYVLIGWWFYLHVLCFSSIVKRHTVTCFRVSWLLMWWHHTSCGDITLLVDLQLDWRSKTWSALMQRIKTVWTLYKCGYFMRRR